MDEFVPIPSFMPTDEDAVKKFHVEQRQLRQKHNAAGLLIRKQADARFIDYQEREAILAEQTIGIFEEGDPRLDEQRKRLALALMHLGRFEDARVAAPDEETLRRINEMADAVDADDKAGCGCTDDRTKKEVLTRFHPKTWVKSEKHGSIVPVRSCSKCRTRNATNVIP